MCMNCGCGDPERRARPTDITKRDVQRAADGSHVSVAAVLGNMRTSLEQVEMEENGLTRPKDEREVSVPRN